MGTEHNSTQSVGISGISKVGFGGFVGSGWSIRTGLARCRRSL